MRSSDPQSVTMSPQIRVSSLSRGVPRAQGFRSCRRYCSAVAAGIHGAPRTGVENEQRSGPGALSTPLTKPVSRRSNPRDAVFYELNVPRSAAGTTERFETRAQGNPTHAAVCLRARPAHRFERSVPDSWLLSCAVLRRASCRGCTHATEGICLQIGCHEKSGVLTRSTHCLGVRVQSVHVAQCVLDRRDVCPRPTENV